MRSLVKSLDTALLQGFCRWNIRAWRKWRFNKRLSAVNSCAMECSYKNPASGHLATLFDQHGSDKGSARNFGHAYPWPPHSYSDLYELLLTPTREYVRLVIECGIGTNNPQLSSSMGASGRPGASLRAWRDFFPNAKIIGVDIDDTILFAEPCIETFKCDQTSPESIHQFRAQANLAPRSVDLIIDDGLHEFAAGRTFFENMADLMSETGIYLIEDVKPDDALRYANYFAGTAFGVYIFSIPKPTLPIGYNTTILIRMSTSAYSM